MRRGTADLPLHTGKCPSWLFKNMEALGDAIAQTVVAEHGTDTFLERLSDPYWFQALGCVLGYDFHSSGVTTTTMGALKEALGLETHGLAVCGGKGNTSKKTVDELAQLDEHVNLPLDELREASRLSAAVDNNCVQDQHTLYHHTVIVAETGEWAVVQQGMNHEHSFARRYHWHCESVDNFVVEPQNGIAAQTQLSETLNLSGDSQETREVAVDLVNDNPKHLERYLDPGQCSLEAFTSNTEVKQLAMPRKHRLALEDLSPRSITQLQQAYEKQPADFQELVETNGVGKQSLRALALIAELVYGSESDWSDPAKYSFAHGGKDGTPFPVDRDAMADTTEFLQATLRNADLAREEKENGLKRLHTAFQG